MSELMAPKSSRSVGKTWESNIVILETWKILWYIIKKKMLELDQDFADMMIWLYLQNVSNVGG